MKIGIVGYGHVGSAMKELFKDAFVYDKFKNIGSKQEINECKVVFVCVPTPMMENGECDTSSVEEVISWCKVELIILRSTVKIGFTKEMVKKYHKKIVFQPEYYGETVAHPYANLSDRNWLSFGGEPESIDLAIDAYKTVINSSVRILQGTSDEVEMAKYMENSYLALKVTFCNELYDLCQKMNINYNVIREIWTEDPRIGKNHTFIYKDNRGYGGSCLPKDIASLQKQGHEYGCDMTLIDAVINKNKQYK